MNVKYQVGGGCLAGIVIFMWSAIAHLALPLPEPIQRFNNGQPVMDAIKAQTNGNGVYFDPRGIFTTVRLTADSADMSKNMGPYMAREVASNVAQGILLAVLLTALRPRNTRGFAGWGLVLGLFSWVAFDVSMWTWYGFSWQLITYDLFDVPVATALGALLLGWMMNRTSNKPAAAA